MLKRIKYILVVFFISLNSLVFAQGLYVAELGAHGGISYFFGDVQHKPFDIKPDFGATLRYLINNRLSLMADYNHSYIWGDYTMRVDNIHVPNVTLNQQINALDFLFAFNFFDYGRLDYLLNSSNHTFYMFTGVGLMHLHHDHSVHFSLPVGVGYKVKITDRIHFNAQWTHRLMFGDNLEGNPKLNNPLGIKGTNFLNNDQFGTATVGFSVGLLRRKCNCNYYY